VTLTQLVDSIGAGRTITDPDLVREFCHDEHSYVTPGSPCAVVIAQTAEDVQAAVRWAAEHRVPSSRAEREPGSSAARPPPTAAWSSRWRR